VKSFKEYVESVMEDQMQLDEMTSVSSRNSGLSQHVWISAKGNAKHGARIKVSNTPGKFDTSDNFSLSVSREPEIRSGMCKLSSFELENVKDWVRLNHDHLLKVWVSDTMDSVDHIDGLGKL
jgi:hypothetical protein